MHVEYTVKGGSKGVDVLLTGFCLQLIKLRRHCTEMLESSSHLHLPIQNLPLSRE